MRTRAREREARYVQQTVAGLQPVDVELGGSGARAPRCSSSPPSSGPRSTPSGCSRALGLAPADAHPELPPQVVSTGVAQLMVPVRDAEVLGRVRPDAVALGDCCASSGHLRVSRRP